MAKTIRFTLNGEPASVTTEADRMLLWVLRTELGLTGTKFGCGEGFCGSCSVVVDGRVERSCQLPMEKVAGAEVLTIEGLADGDDLHPLQQAFVDHDALQCGFCTPGMIMNAYGLLEDEKAPSRSRINDAMEDNLCRCGAHKRIVAAIESVAEKMAKEAKS
jgi:aerobic-type carbon monoxide dehydrogenase small subunit (CoxS/CutS family)